LSLPPREVLTPKGFSPLFKRGGWTPNSATYIENFRGLFYSRPPFGGSGDTPQTHLRGCAKTPPCDNNFGRRL